jgi:hypothetical protein
MLFAHNSLRIVSLAVGLILCTAIAQASNWQSFGGTGSGDWNDPNHWDAGVPDTATETANYTTVINPQNGPHTIALNEAMYPGGLVSGSITFNTGNVGIGNTRFIQIDAKGVNSPLSWTVGSATAPGKMNFRRHMLNLDNVQLNFAGTPGSTPLTLAGVTESLTPNPQEWNLDATNSTVSILAAPAGATDAGISVTSGGGMRMNGGTLTVTNAAQDAKISILGVEGSFHSRLNLKDTQLTTNAFEVTGTGNFTFDGTNAVGPSSISNQLLVTAGEVNLAGGTLNAGSVSMNFPNTNNTGTVNVTGATLNVTGAFDIQSTSTTPVGAFPSTLNISAGTVSAAGMEVGGSSADKGAFGINLSGSGSLAVSGTLLLGYDLASNRHGAGTIVMTGGSLGASTLKVGAARGSNPNSRGYYEQTGGSSSFGSVVLNRDDLTPSGYGTQQFVVGAGATMNITGAGFSQIGTGDWHADDTPGNLDFSGKLVFNPSSPITQTLLAFGDDQGVYELIADDLTPAILDNYGIGTLDLSHLNGSEKLWVSAAGNFATNALYVNALVGLSSGNVADLLDSPIDIFYNTAHSPGLLGLTYQLNSGGSLVPLTAIVPAPEPSSSLLLSLGSLALLGSTRRRLARGKVKLGQGL